MIAIYRRLLYKGE